MKITDINVKTFRYESQIVRDDEGHTHPGDSHEATQTLLTIDTDEGVQGHAFGANKEISENLLFKYDANVQADIPAPITIKS